MEENMGKRYYAMMINALAGLQDDFDTNSVPDEAKSLLQEVIEICRSDFNIRFGGDELRNYGDNKL